MREIRSYSPGLGIEKGLFVGLPLPPAGDALQPKMGTDEPRCSGDHAPPVALPSRFGQITFRKQKACRNALTVGRFDDISFA
jgi:hypothetical protein